MRYLYRFISPGLVVLMVVFSLPLQAAQPIDICKSLGLNPAEKS